MPRLFNFARLSKEQKHMLIQVGYNGRRFLTPGKSVLYQAGQDKYRVEARATISMMPGMTSVYVHINEVMSMGEEAEIQVGDIVLAGFDEVYFEDESPGQILPHRAVRRKLAG